MIKTYIRTITISFLIAFLFGQCSKKIPFHKNTTIKGQVFVIQKNRVNIKLGAVTVNYIPQSVFENRTAWILRNKDLADEINQHESKLRYIDKRLQQLENQKNIEQLDEFIISARQIQEDSWSKFNGHPGALEILDISNLEQGAPFRSIKIETNYRWSLASFFAEWPINARANHANTDADGNFSIEIPSKDRGYLIVESQREVIKNQFEYYYWIHEVAGDQPGSIQLTTENTITSAMLKGIFDKTQLDESYVRPTISEFDLKPLNWFDETEPLTREFEKNNASIITLKDEINNLQSRLSKIR